MSPKDDLTPKEPEDDNDEFEFDDEFGLGVEPDPNEYVSTRAGHELPADLSCERARVSTVYGIRHHISFAQSTDITKLAALPGNELFARARNARLIMSNEIPAAMMRETSPYCIHYPDVADEETYRTLAERYPGMRYQIGRACAVAGYANLYRELGLLPDVSIAEEARENRKRAGAQEIFAQIMAAPIRYRVMDDYTLTVNVDTPEAPARLNGDTAVLGTPAGRFHLLQCYLESFNGFDITEDGCMGANHPDLETESGSPAALAPHEMALLHSPLPFDLPSMHKTVLTLSAAYHGDIDRWDRLRGRRTWPLRLEATCLARGCQFNTPMAVWLSQSPHILDSLGITNYWDRDPIKRAINARFVMDDSIQPLLDPSTVPDKELPYWIWHPDLPHPELVEQLARARPAMRPQCARVCIVANWQTLYDTIMGLGPADVPWLDEAVMDEARRSPNPHYLRDLERRVRERGGTAVLRCEGPHEWKLCTPERHANCRAQDGTGVQEVPLKLFDSWWQMDPGEGGEDPSSEWFWEGVGCASRQVDRYLTATEAERGEVRRQWDEYVEERWAKGIKW